MIYYKYTCIKQICVYVSLSLILNLILFRKQKKKKGREKIIIEKYTI